MDFDQVTVNGVNSNGIVKIHLLTASDIFNIINTIIYYAGAYDSGIR